MAEPELPQIYLITPPEIDLSSFPNALEKILDTVEIACLRLALSTQDEDRQIRASDQLRSVAHARDIPVVIDTHIQLVQRLGLDGVHLHDGARSVRAARKELGQDAIVGTFCGNSRHDGLNAGEAGADYVSFGPVAETALGDGRHADRDLFAWWTEMIEVPIVAEGALDIARMRELAEVTDFIAIGPEIWTNEDPLLALRNLVAAMAG